MNLILNLVYFSYTSTVKKLSNVYRDRPLSPMKTAIYWIEYVIRHQGAPHMRSPAMDLNLLQRNSVDVIAFLALIVLIVVQFVKCMLKGFIRVVKALIKSMRHKDDEENELIENKKVV